MRKVYTLFFAITIVFIANAQVKIGNDPTTVNVNSLLELESTTKGLLIPRIALTTNSTNASPFASHVAGMIIYNTATVGDVVPAFYYNDGAKWVRIAGEGIASTEPWFNVASNMGATSNTQNIYQMGNVGIGTPTPQAPLHVSGTGAIIVPVGTSTERPNTAVPGMIRYNTTISKFEGYNGTSWQALN